MGYPALTYREKEDELNFLGLWKKSDGSEKSYKYYPFGLQTSTSWTRENTKDNNYLYNAANELNKTNGWYEMYYRGYDPAIGRMLQVDPYAASYASFTTYNYAVNNPVMINDPNGGEASITEGKYAAFWNTVMAGVKAKAWEPGWYGGSWSEDKGENLFDSKELDSYVDAHKNMLFVQIISESDEVLVTKSIDRLKLILSDRKINLDVVFDFRKKIMSKTSFYMSRGENSSYILVGKPGDLVDAAEFAEDNGWEAVVSKGENKDFVDVPGTSALNDNFSVVNLELVYSRILMTAQETFDEYPDNNDGVMMRLTDWIRHEHVHHFYRDSKGFAHVMGTIVQKGPTRMGYDYNDDMLNTLRDLFPY